MKAGLEDPGPNRGVYITAETLEGADFLKDLWTRKPRVVELQTARSDPTFASLVIAPTEAE